jgi:cell division protein FtsL
MLIFSKSQIAVGLVSGVVEAVFSIAKGIVPKTLAVESVEAAIFGYLVVTAFIFVCSVLCAPVRLDQMRVEEISEKDRKIAEKQSALEQVESKLAAMSTQSLTGLEKYHIGNAQRAIKDYGDDAKAVLLHLHTHGLLVFGSYDPMLPRGITKDRMLSLLRILGNTGLVSETLNSTNTGVHHQFGLSEGARDPLSKFLFH